MAQAWTRSRSISLEQQYHIGARAPSIVAAADRELEFGRSDALDVAGQHLVDTRSARRHVDKTEHPVGKAPLISPKSIVTDETPFEWAAAESAIGLHHGR